jgi:hypothetical protein
VDKRTKRGECNISEWINALDRLEIRAEHVPLRALFTVQQRVQHESGWRVDGADGFEAIGVRLVAESANAWPL